MLILLQISCLLNSKATFQIQTNTLQFSSGYNPYLLPKEKVLCDQFYGESINLNIIIGPFTFVAENVLYSSLDHLILTPKDASDLSDIGLYTVARFTLVLTKQLVDQSGQIDSFAIRRYDRVQCFESAVIILDESKIQLEYGKQSCQFDAGNSYAIIQLLNKTQFTTVLNSSLGVVDFNQIQTMTVTETCLTDDCLENLKFITSLDAVTGFLQFQTEQKFTKLVKDLNMSGIDIEVSQDLTFNLINLVPLEYAKSFYDQPSDAIFYPQQNYIYIQNFPILTDPITSITYVFTSTYSVIQFEGPYQNIDNYIINCQRSGCLPAMHEIQSNFTSGISYAYANLENGSRILVSSNYVKSCISHVNIVLYQFEICADAALHNDCEFDNDIQMIEISLLGHELSGSFSVNTNSVRYCFQSDSELENKITGSNVLDGQVSIGTEVYGFSTVECLIQGNSFYLGWGVFVAGVIAIAVIQVIVYFKDKKKNQQ